VYVTLNVIAYALWVTALAACGLAWPVAPATVFVAVFGLISACFVLCLALFSFYWLNLQEFLNLPDKQKSRATLAKVFWMTAVCTVCFSIRALLTVLQLCEVRAAMQFKHAFHYVYFCAFDMVPLGALLFSLHHLSAKKQAAAAPESSGLLARHLHAHDQYHSLAAGPCAAV
jgi:hypothetical protein